jgi:hypothetical protein
MSKNFPGSCPDPIKREGEKREGVEWEKSGGKERGEEGREHSANKFLRLYSFFCEPRDAIVFLLLDIQNVSCS